jgi:Fe-S-cluster-containing hydrogenase component 2
MNDEATGGNGVTRPPAVNAADQPGDLSRRAFLKQTGAVAASAALVGLGVAGLVAGPAFPAIAEAGGVIMPDPALCIGCLTCEVACSDVHREAGLSDVPRIRIYNRAEVTVAPQIIASFGERGHFFQHVCLQCPDAPCLPVCPTEALRVEPRTGARVIDPTTCIACGKCEQACIFATPDESEATSSQRFGQRSRITYDARMNVFAKCDMCYFREEGPACIAQCPVNVRINEGLVKSDVLCLDVLTPVNAENFRRMREQQTVE